MKTRVIYIMSQRSSFVDVDISFLSKQYDLVINTYNWRKKALVPLNMGKQFFFLLKYCFSAKSVIISSGGYWSLLPVLFGKLFSVPVHIILNGSDCASWPMLNYGNLRSGLLRNICRISYKYAAMLLPVSESLVETKNTYYSPDHPICQGYHYFFPDIKTSYQVIFNGLDHEYWKQETQTGKEHNSFISVFSPSQFTLKGGDLIVEIARKFPECNFYMAGLSHHPGNIEVSPNVRFLGHLKPAELKTWYSRSRFHFQLSIFEGFGCTLCEAMLCNCIPIGSEVNIIPMIIGDSGFILKQRNISLLEELISDALQSPNKNERGEKARKRIIEKFSIEGRSQQLYSLIK